MYEDLTPKQQEQLDEMIEGEIDETLMEKSLCCSAPIDERGFCQDCKEHA